MRNEPEVSPVAREWRLRFLRVLAGEEVVEAGDPPEAREARVEEMTRSVEAGLDPWGRAVRPTRSTLEVAAELGEQDDDALDRAAVYDAVEARRAERRAALRLGGDEDDDQEDDQDEGGEAAAA